MRNSWWIIDYNRQSLDAIAREGLFARLEALFQAFGWNVVVLKYGVLQQAAFAEPGGERLREWIDPCPNRFIPRCCSRAARPGASASPMNWATRAR